MTFKAWEATPAELKNCMCDPISETARLLFDIIEKARQASDNMSSIIAGGYTGNEGDWVSMFEVAMDDIEKSADCTLRNLAGVMREDQREMQLQRHKTIRISNPPENVDGEAPSP